MKYVLGAKCVKCGREYPAAPGLTTCACGGILDIVYDYAAIRRHFSPKSLADCRDYSMWRYRPLLPVEEESAPPPLRVGWSPLYKADRLARALGLDTLYLKDDGQNPTSSLKDRASALAVVKAREAGGGHHCLLLHRQRRLIPGGQRGGGRAVHLHLCAQPRPQGQGGPAADLRRHGHQRGGLL